jgi:hypothetical protein
MAGPSDSRELHAATAIKQTTAGHRTLLGRAVDQHPCRHLQGSAATQPLPSSPSPPWPAERRGDAGVPAERRRQRRSKKGVASKMCSIAFHHGLDRAQLVDDQLMPRQSIRAAEKRRPPLDPAVNSPDSLPPSPPRPAERGNSSRTSSKIQGQQKSRRALFTEILAAYLPFTCGSDHRSAVTRSTAASQAEIQLDGSRPHLPAKSRLLA